MPALQGERAAEYLKEQGSFASLQEALRDARARATLSYGAGLAYPATTNPTLIQETYLKGSNTDEGDQLGSAVAVSGETVVVGASFEFNGSDTGPVAGAAYVFVRQGGAWSEQAYLKASNRNGFDRFGSSVSVSGDTIVVGAPAEDSGATGAGGNQDDESVTDSGAAYVFVRSGTTWTQQAYLKASNPGQSDWFGGAVSVSGDTVVVGAFSEDSSAAGVNVEQADNSASDSGAAYVFTRSGATWSQQAYLKASNAGAGDQFGSAVAVSGETVVVGAPKEDSSATGVAGNQSSNSVFNAGATYVFARSGATWSQQAYLKSINPPAFGDEFGTSAAVSGDTVVVGTFRALFVYVFVRDGVTWGPQASLKVTQSSPDQDLFGSSVSVSGDTVVVGAPFEDGGGPALTATRTMSRRPTPGPLTCSRGAA